MKQISLTQGKVAIVDDADYEELSKYKWHVLKMNGGNFYALRTSPLKNGKCYAIYMTRQILGLKYGDSRMGDHIDHNTLDNRRVNIRICTSLENQRNQKLRSNTTSKYKGVSWHREKRKWEVSISINKKRKYLGSFVKEKLAALAYDIAAVKYHGEFAHLNF